MGRVPRRSKKFNSNGVEARRSYGAMLFALYISIQTTAISIFILGISWDLDANFIKDDHAVVALLFFLFSMIFSLGLTLIFCDFLNRGLGDFPKPILFSYGAIWIPIHFAMLYTSISTFGVCLNGVSGPFDFYYFSYVTLTTLGYGDIQPVGWCKPFAIMEAISGYILLGVIVAGFTYQAVKDR